VQHPPKAYSPPKVTVHNPPKAYSPHKVYSTPNCKVHSSSKIQKELLVMGSRSLQVHNYSKQCHCILINVKIFIQPNSWDQEKALSTVLWMPSTGLWGMQTMFGQAKVWRKRDQETMLRETKVQPNDNTYTYHSNRVLITENR